MIIITSLLPPLNYLFNFRWVKKSYEPIFCCLALFNPFISISSQSIDFKCLTTKEGLSSNSFNTFIQMDSKGLIWIGSTEGVSCYDGKSINVYRSKNFNILGDNIQSNFFEDKNTNLWFTNYTGLNCYQRKHNRFINFQFNLPNGQLIDKGYHLFYHQENKNVLWVKADRWIFQFDANYPNNYSLAMPLEVTGNRFISNIDEKENLNRIISCPYLNDIGNIEIYEKSNKNIWECISVELSSPKSKNKLSVFDGVFESDSLVWLFSDEGLVSLNINKKRVMELYQPSNKNESFMKSGIWYGRSKLLIPSQANGVLTFNTKSKQFESSLNFRDNPLLKDPIGIYLDKQERIWVPTLRNGVAYSLKHKFKSRKLPFPKEKKVVGVFEDPEDGICVILKHRNELVKEKIIVSEDHLETHKLKKIISLTGVEKIVKVSDSLLWLIGHQGLLIFDIQAKTLKNFKIENSSVSSQSIINVFPLSEGYNLVMTDKGMKEGVFKNDTFQVKENTQLNQIRGFSSVTIFESSEGRIYIPNDATQLLEFQKDNGNLQKVRSTSIETDVFDFYEDETEGIIWIGSSSGLGKINADGTLTYVLQEDWQLGKSYIYGVEGESNGNLWLIASNGLWVYNPFKEQLIRYTKENGLFVENFTTRSKLKIINDAIWIIDDKQIIHFST